MFKSSETEKKRKKKTSAAAKRAKQNKLFGSKEPSGDAVQVIWQQRTLGIRSLKSGCGQKLVFGYGRCENNRGREASDQCFNQIFNKAKAHDIKM